ncbi:hypothetical protein FMA36_11135 [Komagataeibacter xylinus]|uniref:Uncharacterized protein n=1 Tax=Komagataeibacter xylinus TaxID=28448 RepID=A0A857FNU7_KOMXY|nr:hypothetical protein FMA36_11135 [Komagataeibacter xylinus]
MRKLKKFLGKLFSKSFKERHFFEKRRHSKIFIRVCPQCAPRGWRSGAAPACLHHDGESAPGHNSRQATGPGPERQGSRGSGAS